MNAGMKMNTGMKWIQEWNWMQPWWKWRHKSMYNWIYKTKCLNETFMYKYMYTRRQPSYSDSCSCTVIKSVKTSFRSTHTHCFLHKYIVWYRTFIYMQSSMVSFTLLIACTTSDVAVQWLSSSVVQSYQKEVNDKYLECSDVQHTGPGRVTSMFELST